MTTDGTRPAREALGGRLRDIRNDAGLTARAVARAASWPPSKVSKLEYGNQTPTETDIRDWCRICGADDQVPDLIAVMRNIAAAYLEFRRMRLPHRQRQSISWEAETRLMRWYEPVVVPGLLQTPAYAEAILARIQDFYHGSRDDLAASLAARMERQQILYRGDHRFHFLIAQQVLETTVGDNDTMIGQLDRLLIAMSLPRVVLGVIPERADYVVPLVNFCMFDQRRVLVETITAELSVTQPREIVMYERVFQNLVRQAAIGDQARALIRDELERRIGSGPATDQATASQ